MRSASTPLANLGRPRTARTRACRVETHLDATTRPPILPHGFHDPSLHRIIFDITPNPIELLLIPNPLIVRFLLPKRTPSASQNPIPLPCGHALQRLHQMADTDFRQNQQMNMIRHNGVSIKFIVTQLHALINRLHNHICDSRFLQVQRPPARSIQIPIHARKCFTSRHLRGRHCHRRRQTPVQTPGNKKSLSFRINMQQPSSMYFHSPTECPTTPKFLSTPAPQHAPVPTPH